MNEIKITNNFLPYSSIIHDLCKKLEFYDNENFNKKFQKNVSWPGLRSDLLNNVAPFLYIHILTLLEKSLFNTFQKYKSFHIYAHVRFTEDDSKDWIHTDRSDTVLIYLSPTNYNSGTDFYDNQKNLIVSNKFIQGSCVFFEEGILHRSIGNHGDNIDNGRMTLNIFMNK